MHENKKKFSYLILKQNQRTCLLGLKSCMWEIRNKTIKAKKKKEEINTRNSTSLKYKFTSIEIVYPSDANRNEHFMYVVRTQALSCLSLRLTIIVSAVCIP